MKLLHLPKIRIINKSIPSANTDGARALKIKRYTKKKVLDRSVVSFPNGAREYSPPLKIDGKTHTNGIFDSFL